MEDTYLVCQYSLVCKSRSKARSSKIGSRCLSLVDCEITCSSCPELFDRDAEISPRDCRMMVGISATSHMPPLPAQRLFGGCNTSSSACLSVLCPRPRYTNLKVSRIIFCLFPSSTSKLLELSIRHSISYMSWSWDWSCMRTLKINTWSMKYW